jgi:hypothetical protein
MRMIGDSIVEDWKNNIEPDRKHEDGRFCPEVTSRQAPVSWHTGSVLG